MSDDTILGIGISHQHALLAAYALTLLCWNRVVRRAAGLWPKPAPIVFAHPWREVGIFALALAAVLLIGQLFVHHRLLPSRGPLAPVIDALNQLIIFAPVLLVPFLRRRTDTAGAPGTFRARAGDVLAGMWLPIRRVWARVLIGVVLSLIAVLVFTSVRSGSDPFVDVVSRVYHPKNLGNLVQVLCEDVAIAILFVRLRAALGLGRTIVAVAVLFAAAHIPALVANGAGVAELAGLVLDAGLGVLALFFLQRAGDVWWFWWVHFAMDMMQFYAVPGTTV